MSTLSLYETIQRIVQEELRRVHTAQLAVVQEQHPHAGASDQDNYSCTVKLRNSALVLKQVPVATSRIGQVSIPAVGDLVLVQFVGGDINAPIIVGSLYNDEDRPRSTPTASRSCTCLWLALTVTPFTLKLTATVNERSTSNWAAASKSICAMMTPLSRSPSAAAPPSRSTATARST